MDSSNPPPSSSPVKLLAVWLVVGLPAVWGVGKTVQTSLNLFRTPAAVSAPASVGAPASRPVSSASKVLHTGKILSSALSAV